MLHSVQALVILILVDYSFQTMPYPLHHPRISAQQSGNPVMLRKSLNQLLQKFKIGTFSKMPAPSALFPRLSLLLWMIQSNPKAKKRAPWRRRCWIPTCPVWTRDYLKYARWKKHIKPGFILLIKPGFKFNLKLGLKYYIKPTVLSCGGAAMKVRLG